MEETLIVFPLRKKMIDLGKSVTKNLYWISFKCCSFTNGAFFTEYDCIIGSLYSPLYTFDLSSRTAITDALYEDNHD
jgi:hypothetical protein